MANPEALTDMLQWVCLFALSVLGIALAMRTRADSPRAPRNQAEVAALPAELRKVFLPEPERPRGQVSGRAPALTMGQVSRMARVRVEVVSL